MKTSILCLLLVTSNLLITINLSAAIEGSSNKDKWKSAEDYLSYDNFDNALEIYMQLFKDDSQNFNNAYKIGYCNVSGEAGQDIGAAIEYLKLASEHVNKKYKNSFKEKDAPIYTYYYLGVAYRLNKEFDKAINAFKTYQSLMNKSEKNSVRGAFLEREIQSCRDAMEVIDAKRMKIEGLLVKDLKDPSVRCPILSEGASRLFFTNGKSNVFPPDVNYDKDYDDASFDYVFTAKRTEKGDFYSPENISNDLQIQYPYIPVTATADGSELYLIVDLFDNGDIYMSKYIDGKYQKAEPVKALNTNKWESHASITKDGKRIYFTSNRKGGQGGLDIWYSDRDAEGNWLEPINLGAEINTPFHEEMPYIIRNGNALYFSSEGHTNIGGFDMFYSNFDENTKKWSNPINLGYPFSTSGNDMGYILENTPSFVFCPVNDNKRRDGVGECDCISLIDEEAPMLASVSGIVKLNPDNAELLLQTRVKLVDKATGKEISNVPVDANGKYFIDGVKTGTYDVIAYDNYGDLASRQIIVPQNENWAITDIDMTMPTDGYIASNNATNNNSNNNVSSDLISVKNILFDNDSFTIDDIFKSDLKMISEYLKSTPNARIEIQGYCSQTGSSDYNMLLSTKRAENVKNAIIANGASAGQIEIKSFGYSNPIASNLYPDSRMFNRRTEIKILKDAPKLNPIQVYVPTYYRATEDLNYKDGAYFYSELKVFNELVVECVFFDFDKSDIRTEYTENLNILADYLKKNDKAKIKITGHTDYYGSDEYNMVLSQNRVVSVSNYLKSKGVKDSQIVMDFVGKKENITVATKDDMIRRLNRRVIITVLEQGTPTLKIAPIEVPKEYQIK